MPLKLIIATIFGLIAVLGNAQVVISEFVVSNSLWPDEANEFHPWLEVQSVAADMTELQGLKVSIDTVANISWEFPAIQLAPGDYAVVYFSGLDKTSGELHASFNIPDDIRYIALVRDDVTTDVLTFAFPPDKNESIGRNPVKPGEFIHYPSGHVTRGGTNWKPVVWKKLTNKTGFEPRDSAPNAALVFDGKIWVLAGYRFTGVDWRSSSDVWCSSDGIHWELKNPSPPYNPYSGYAVFKEKLWAFDPSGCYSSVDGVVWQNESPGGFPGGWSARITVFNDELWYYNDRKIGKSSDGITWTTVLDDVPWEGNRAWPAFVNHNGRLYFFGGGINANTGNDYYYNDVWSSSDGIHWELLTPNAEWPGRHWFSYFSFDGKLWMMGGWDYSQYLNGEYGNAHDVWVSPDGKHWKQVISDEIWPTRHAALSWVKDNALYLSSGYGGNGRMHSDVWVCEDKDDLILQPLPSTVTYGDEITVDWLEGVNIEIENSEVLEVDQYHLIATNTGSSHYRQYFVGNEQYYPTYEDGMLSVTPRELTVGVADTSKVYGDPLPQARIYCLGLRNGDDLMSAFLELPVVTTGAGSESPVGDYELVPSGGILSSNYFLVETKTGRLTVTPRKLTVKVLDTERKYGDPNPEFKVEYSGFALDDDESDISQKPVVSTGADRYSAVGTYEITVSGGAAPNYLFEYVPGILTVEPAHVIFTYPNPAVSEINFVTPFEFKEGDFIEIYSQQGVRVMRQMLSAITDNRCQLEIESLPVGVYFYKLANDRHLFQGKFVVR